jgi:hypothetical protein
MFNSSPSLLGEGDHAQHGGGAPRSGVHVERFPATASPPLHHRFAAVPLPCGAGEEF